MCWKIKCPPAFGGSWHLWRYAVHLWRCMPGFVDYCCDPLTNSDVASVSSESLFLASVGLAVGVAADRSLSRVSCERCWGSCCWVLVGLSCSSRMALSEGSSFGSAFPFPNRSFLRRISVDAILLASDRKTICLLTIRTTAKTYYPMTMMKRATSTNCRVKSVLINIMSLLL